MICPACGANLADDLKFCTQCGSALEAAPVVEEPVAEVACDTCAFEPEAAQEPVFDAEIAPEAFDQIPEEVAEPEQPADKKPMIFAIIGIVTAAISFLAGCCFGMYGLCISIPLGIVAIVMGVLGIIFGKKAGNKTALILSIISIVLVPISIVGAIVSVVAGGAILSMFGLGMESGLLY